MIISYNCSPYLLKLLITLVISLLQVTTIIIHIDTITSCSNRSAQHVGYNGSTRPKTSRLVVPKVVMCKQKSFITAGSSISNNSKCLLQGRRCRRLKWPIIYYTQIILNNKISNSDIFIIFQLVNLWNS